MLFGEKWGNKEKGKQFLDFSCRCDTFTFLPPRSSLEQF